ncbi:MAG: hypothetical protein ACTSRG_02665 [Candidatus Helarchaeota archaeon]
MGGFYGMLMQMGDQDFLRYLLIIIIIILGVVIVSSVVFYKIRKNKDLENDKVKLSDSENKKKVIDDKLINLDEEQKRLEMGQEELKTRLESLKKQKVKLVFYQKN